MSRILLYFKKRMDPKDGEPPAPFYTVLSGYAAQISPNLTNFKNFIN